MKKFGAKKVTLKDEVKNRDSYLYISNPRDILIYKRLCKTIS